ncbi:hypothetical protein ACFYOF_43935 [Streptomyces sp. NPDC007148]|uniref:hypothetical protein n=1 Tax=unclassified Streptomyces TaxID=2593676 RepID=UPI00369BDED1
MAQISLDPAVRAPRLNGGADAEVILMWGEVEPGPDLHGRLTAVTARLEAALIVLSEIRSYAVSHGPKPWRDHYGALDESPLADRLFLECFEVDAALNVTVWFDFGGLEMIAVVLDASGRGRVAELHP